MVTSINAHINSFHTYNLGHASTNFDPARASRGGGEADCLISTKGVEFWKGTSFWNHDIPMGQSKRMSASTSILVDKSLAPQITSNGIFLEGRTQYITFKLSNNENLTIANIYGTHTSNEQAFMWK
jgi:hypothetical protein